MTSIYFVFDVESAGLYGEGFAVGWVVMDSQGAELERGYLGAPFEALTCTEKSRNWMEANVLPHLPPPNCKDTDEVRRKFWETWLRWETVGAVAVADVPYPVETSFLLRCVRTVGNHAATKAPYPLLDVATALAASGKDPIGTYDRLPSEEPAHHPTSDSAQSARLFLEALKYAAKP